MKFEFVTEKQNYEDYAAGRVILSQSGMTSFPVRLASELFQQAYTAIGKEKITVYDPCCGGGYLLTVLGLLHPEKIAALYASDIDFNALTLAQKNLSLLSYQALSARKSSLQDLYTAYGKDSHAEAISSCEALFKNLPETPIPQELWLADALNPSIKPKSIDLLICDVPYGDKVTWQTIGDSEPIYQLLEQAHPIFSAASLAVIISDKKQKAAHPHYEKFKAAQHGNRRISFLKPK